MSLEMAYRKDRVVLKFGQEEFIIALKKAVAIQRQAPTVNI